MQLPVNPAGISWNEASIESIAECFAKRVDTFPERVAIKTANRVLSYRELNQAANRVAHGILAKRGEGEEPIALLAGHGIDALVMLLGVLKAGKFYVPLDPTHPRGRLNGVVQDADPALILSDSQNYSLALDIAVGPREVVDYGASVVNGSNHDPKIRISPDSLGYLFYTSGSTGLPKGVPQSQRNILYQIQIYSSGLGISPDDRITMLHSHAFSASRLDIFASLLCGAALFPFSVAEAGITNLRTLLRDEMITISHWVPSLFRRLADVLEEDEQFPAMRTVVLGSETMLRHDLGLFKRHFGQNCILVNRYGSTEAGNICWEFLNHRSEAAADVVTAGCRIPGADVFLIDEEGKKVETGEVGEICVQSRYLSQGYWKRSDLTESVFLPDPHGGDRRIYLTGDLGRLRPDGRLDHLGRKDSQVKIRGYRIEMNEIEGCLNNHPGVQEAAVGVRGGENVEKQLIGYVVPNEKSTLPAEEIRNYLRLNLPHYMIPSSIKYLTALPRTPNGKVDRQALAGEMSFLPVSAVGVLAPRNDEEQQLLGLWEEILKITPIDVTDNFFALGGHSLLAIQLAAKIATRLGRQMTPATLFLAPTIERLAKFLYGDMPNGELASLLPIQSRGAKTPFFWVHGDSSNAYLGEYLGADQPLYALEHQSQDGVVARFRGVETIAQHYLRQIRTVQLHGPYLLGGYSFGGTIAFEIAQQLRMEGEVVSLLFMLDSHFPGMPSAVFENEGGRTISLATSSQYQGRGVLRHFGVLSQLKAKDKLEYILSRLINLIVDRVGQMSNRLDKIFKSGLCKLYLACGWILPSSVRSFYILEVYKKALQNYSPTSYAGRAVYFKTASRPNYHQESWNKLVLGGLELYELAENHLDMIKREHSAVWAARLAVCISEAQKRSVKVQPDRVSITQQPNHTAN